MPNVLEIDGLCTYFKIHEGTLKAVDGVTLSVGQRKTVGVIGESGCGKSVTAQSILGIVPTPGYVAAGRILFTPMGQVDPIDITAMNPKGDAIRAVRGRHISMIFQEPMTSLSPVHTVGSQIMEAVLLHRTRDKAEAREIALGTLERVGIGHPSQRLEEYPHMLSGGMRQRVMIAMALCCHPSLLVADEPTTALDVTVQAQILELMRELQQELGMSMVYITHDLGVIAEIADEVAVMYLGRIVERGSVHDVFHDPRHPYTRRLLKSIPKIGRRSRQRLDAIDGTVPLPINPPWQCGFLSRCPEAIRATCDRAVPALVRVAGRESPHLVRCFLESTEREAPPQLGMPNKDRGAQSLSPARPTGNGEGAG